MQLATRVESIDGGGVIIGGKRVPARTVLWAAGVKASPLAEGLGVPLDSMGRVKVTGDLSVPGAPNVFVVGDLALVMQDGNPVPGVAPAAMQEGTHAAKMILRRVAGRTTTTFRYFDKGSLATIGRAAAVAEVSGVKLTGLVAWLAWLFIHLLFLIGFKNRVLVLIEWAWAYLAYDRGARVITQRWRSTGAVEPAAIPSTVAAVARESTRAA